MKALVAFLGFTLILGQAGSLEAETLYAFRGAPDGNNPSLSGLIIGKNGSLYGTTEEGGTANQGTVFELSPPGTPGGKWTESILYSFQGGTDGLGPTAGLTAGPQGVFYGVTGGGGQNLLGTVFALTPPAAQGLPWQHSILYSFQGGTDGIGPEAALAIGIEGELYGITASGGSLGIGTIFMLSPPSKSGGAWSETVLYSFQSDTPITSSPLAIGSGGQLFGTTYGEFGSNGQWGTLFELSPPSAPGGSWAWAVLYTFTGQADGGAPTAGLTMGRNGELFGTTAVGGAGYGVVFDLTPPSTEGAAWAYKVIYAFNDTDGSAPEAPVLIGKLGALYGTTTAGFALGNVFELLPPATPGAPWTEIVLHNFTGGPDGISPAAGLAMGTNGVLYGTAGAPKRQVPTYFGTVFFVTPAPEQ
jgi:uncharacterized repeat protein (TIGR03803 family)